MLDTPSTQGNETVNVFTPDYDPLLVNWRSTLAMLIANRLPGFREMMIQLGDKLWRQRHEVSVFLFFKNRTFAGLCCTSLLFTCSYCSTKYNHWTGLQNGLIRC